jgi:pimeloyl-ACP methyl ester carboxylesterase
MSDAATGIVLLHGLGQGPESWDAVRARLAHGRAVVAPQVPGLRDADAAPFSLDGAGAAVLAAMDGAGFDRAHIVGLSLGAVVATRLAARHPERVASLTLSGGQVRPNRAIMRVQSLVLRVLPERLASAPGAGKGRMLEVLSVVTAMDLRPDLARITAPTLVLCGGRDRPNLGAARQLASGIDGAELRIVPGAGHEWNLRQPERFAAELERFLAPRR